MADRAIYFGTLASAFGALARHSDPQVARAALRFSNLVDLLDIKSRAGDAPAFDLENSGFPVHPEVARVSGDLRKGTVEKPTPLDVVVEEMLDEMIVGKRMPNAQHFADVALALYVKRINALGKGESGGDAVVGTSAVETFKRLSPREIEPGRYDVVYEWDYWPATTNQPCVTTARFYLDAEDAVSAETAAKTEIITAAHGYTGAGHTLLSFAQAVDKFQKARLKEVTRITFLTLETPRQHAAEAFRDRLAEIEDESRAWLLRFQVERLRSRGTTTKPGGLFMGEVKTEDFYVNASREETKNRACSAFDEHAVMSHEAYQSVFDMKEFLKRTAIHVLSTDGRSLKENI